MERIYEKINYTIFDLTKATEYRKILAENELESIPNANRLESSLSQINYHLEYIMQYYNEYYAIIAFKNACHCSLLIRDILIIIINLRYLILILN